MYYWKESFGDGLFLCFEFPSLTSMTYSKTKQLLISRCVHGRTSGSKLARPPMMDADENELLSCLGTKDFHSSLRCLPSPQPASIFSFPFSSLFSFPFYFCFLFILFSLTRLCSTWDRMQDLSTVGEQSAYCWAASVSHLCLYP